jgi:hypothetical protein
MGNKKYNNYGFDLVQSLDAFNSNAERPFADGDERSEYLRAALDWHGAVFPDPEEEDCASYYIFQNGEAKVIGPNGKFQRDLPTLKIVHG